MSPAGLADKKDVARPAIIWIMDCGFAGVVTNKRFVTCIPGLPNELHFSSDGFLKDLLLAQRLTIVP
jgi:hypothetical protein